MQYRPQSADDSAYDLTGKRGDVLQTCVPEQEGSAQKSTVPHSRGPMSEMTEPIDQVVT